MPIFRKRIQTIVPLHEVANSAAVFPQLDSPPSPTITPTIATLLPLRRSSPQPRTLPARKNKRLRPSPNNPNLRSINPSVNNTVNPTVISAPLDTPTLFVPPVESQPVLSQPSINSPTIVQSQPKPVEKSAPSSPGILHISASTLRSPRPKTLTLRTRSARATSPRVLRPTDQNGNSSTPSIFQPLSEKDKSRDILRNVVKDRIYKKPVNSTLSTRPVLRQLPCRLDNLATFTTQNLKASENTSTNPPNSCPAKDLSSPPPQRSTSSAKIASSNSVNKRRSKTALQPSSGKVENVIILLSPDELVQSSSPKSSDSSPDKTPSGAPSQRRSSYGRAILQSAKNSIHTIAESHSDSIDQIALENVKSSAKASSSAPHVSGTDINPNSGSPKTPSSGKTTPPKRSKSAKYSGPSPLSDAVRSSAVTRSQAHSDPEPSSDGPNTSSALVLSKRKRRVVVAVANGRSLEVKQEPYRERNQAIGDDASDTSTKALLKISSIAKHRKVVWTKIKGHPFWPSQFVTESEELQQQSRFQKAMHYSRRGDNQCVMYFGTCEIAFVNPEKSCIAWDDGIKKGLHNALKGRLFLDALMEVRQYCSKNPRFPKGWWNEPKSIALSSELMEHALEDNAHVKLRSFFLKAEKECVCWAKVRGFPQWPVQVLPHNMAAQNYPELKLNPGEIGNSSSMPCIFFGTSEVMMVSEKALTPFGAGVCRGYVSESERQDFVIAVGEVWGYLQDPRVWPSGLLSKKKWWNHVEEKGSSGKSSSENSWLSRIPYLPRYEHIKKSVYADGVDPFPKPRGTEACCGCSAIGEEDRCMDSSCLNFASSFFCDPATCLAGKFCKNVNFHKRRSPRMTPFFTSDQRGWGLKVDEPVAKGTFVVEYVGEIIDRHELERRLKSMEKVKNNEYYMMDLTNDLLVDAKFKSNLSRFINSSCEPNCETQKWTDTSTGQTHVGIFAIQDIPAGTELTYNYCFLDYGLSGKTRKRSFSCQCGTSSCCMLDPIEQEMMKELIGKRIEVKWDDGWYAGTVEKYSLKKKRFMVQYDDGDCEDLVLGMPLADRDDDVPFRLMEESVESVDGTNDSKSGKASGSR